MKKIIFGTLCVMLFMSSGCPVFAQRVTTRNTAKKIRHSATLPTTCSVGSIYQDDDATSGQQIYLCESADTWVLQGDGGGGGTECVSSACDLHVDTELNNQGICLADGTDCPAAGTGDFLADGTVSMTGTLDMGTNIIDNAGQINADGLAMDANENITLGGQTLDHDGTDFVFSDSIKTTNINITGLTASELLATDASKNIVSLAVATYPSPAELAYVKGLSSAVQAQINAKAPTDADYLVGTANAGLSAEIIVGATPGGELGNTWASPTIDDSVTVDGWVLGDATATTINKVAITAPASASTLTIADGKTLTATNTINLNAMTDEYVCNYEATGTQINCDAATDNAGLCTAGAVCLGGHEHAGASLTDDVFLTDGASDTMTGTLTADGLTLGQNELITLGAQTLTYDGTYFIFNAPFAANPGAVFLKERADPYVNVASFGQMWVNTATPNELWFTGDTDVDVQITDATGLKELNNLETRDPPNVAANEIYIGTGAGAGAWVVSSGDVTNALGDFTVDSFGGDGTTLNYDHATKPKKSIWLSAGGATLPTSGYAEIQDFDGTTLGTHFSYRVLAFDNGTTEYAYWMFPAPDNITGTAANFQTYWTNKSGLTTETFTLEVDTAGIANDQVWHDGALGGTVADITDTWIAQNDMHISGQTSITHDWVAGDMAVVHARRDIATDNLTGDALLIGIRIEYDISEVSE